MAYWGARFTYAIFIWFFLLPETIFFDKDVSEVAYFSTIILFLFPFFLDYINIGSVYRKYCHNVPLIITITGIVFGLGGLMTETLKHEGNILILFHTIEINDVFLYAFLFSMVVFTAIDMGRVESKESDETVEGIRKMSRDRWLKDRAPLEARQRAKDYLAAGREDSE